MCDSPQDIESFCTKPNNTGNDKMLYKPNSTHTNFQSYNME